jgi:phenylpyruvate tautomerase PptA (4-oxalocrotonate tautomerase family)
MPLVRIDHGKHHPAGFGKALGDIVYRAMIEEINVPADDLFQIITPHEGSELNVAQSYLGIEYSAGIVFIQVTLNAGRSIELKKKFYRRIADDASKELGMRQQDVFISLVEVAKENWSFGNGEMQYGPAS